MALKLPDTRVEPGTRARLCDCDPNHNGGLKRNDPEVKAKLERDRKELSALQERLYAEGRQALLIVLQAMDCGGKDGTIRHVLSAFNPQSCDVVPFKAPTPEELAHDFLWRVHRHTPARGHIAVFNRSHYEDVLVARVHRLVPEKVWRQRYEQINAFERHLTDTGTRIVKLFLHISKEEQRRRIQGRIDNPAKHWKLSPSDVPERELWDDYMGAYEDALTHCSTRWAPWHVIPADRKWYRNLVIGPILLETLREMDPRWPEAKVDVSSLVVS